MCAFAGLLGLALGGLRAARILHDQLFSAMLHSPMRFFDVTPIGRILNRFSKDMDAMDVLLAQSFGYVVSCQIETC